MPADESETKYVSYERFGRLFIEHTVTADKIAHALSDLSDSQFDFGPISAGPMGLANVSALVNLGQVQVQRKTGIEVTFAIVIPLRVTLGIDMKVDRQTFNVDGEIHARLRVLTATPLRLIVKVDQPKTRDVKIDVSHAGVRGKLVRMFAFVDSEIKRFVVNYVKQEINKPEILEARDIDLGARIDQAWAAEVANQLLRRTVTADVEQPSIAEVIAAASATIATRATARRPRRGHRPTHSFARPKANNFRRPSPN